MIRQHTSLISLCLPRPEDLNNLMAETDLMVQQYDQKSLY